MIIDTNGRPHRSLDSFNVAVVKPAAFTGADGSNTRGDDGGTSDPFTLFNVTGDVLVRIFGVCTVSLTGATATISVGVAGNTAGLIALETATEIDVNGIYLSATQVSGIVLLSSVTGPHIIINGLDIIETVGTANIETGNIYYVCLWRPLSNDGLVEAAV